MFRLESDEIVDTETHVRADRIPELKQTSAPNLELQLDD